MADVTHEKHQKMDGWNRIQVSMFSGVFILDNPLACCYMLAFFIFSCWIPFVTEGNTKLEPTFKEY